MLKLLHQWWKPQHLQRLPPQAVSLALSLVVDQQERFLALQSFHNLLLDHRLLQVVLQRACLQPACLLLECHRVAQVQVLVRFHHHPDQCLPLVDQYLRLLVVVLRLVVLVLVAQAVSALALDRVLALVHVLVLVVHVRVVLVDHVPVLVVLVLVAPVALVHVLVLPLVLVALVALDLVVLAQEALVAVLVQVALVAVLVLAAVLAAHVMVSVAHLVRSRVHVVGANSMNCSRSSRTTPTAMLQFQKAPSLLNVACLHKSLLQS